MAQWPLGRASDFTDRRIVVGSAAAAASIAGLMLAVPVPFGFSTEAALLGVGVFAAVLSSDALLHGLFCLTFGEAYRRYKERVPRYLLD